MTAAADTVAVTRIGRARVAVLAVCVLVAAVGALAIRARAVSEAGEVTGRPIVGGLVHAPGRRSGVAVAAGPAATARRVALEGGAGLQAGDRAIGARQAYYRVVATSVCWSAGSRSTISSKIEVFVDTLVGRWVVAELRRARTQAIEAAVVGRALVVVVARGARRLGGVDARAALTLRPRELLALSRTLAIAVLRAARIVDRYAIAVGTCLYGRRTGGGAHACLAAVPVTHPHVSSQSEAALQGVGPSSSPPPHPGVARIPTTTTVPKASELRTTRVDFILHMQSSMTAIVRDPKANTSVRHLSRSKADPKRTRQCSTC